MYVERNIKALLSNRFYHGKAVSIIYSERVSLVLGTQYVMFMRRIILPSVSCLTLTYLSTLSHKQHDFLKKKRLLNMKRAFIYTTLLWNSLVLRRMMSAYRLITGTDQFPLFESKEIINFTLWKSFKDANAPHRFVYTYAGSLVLP